MSAIETPAQAAQWHVWQAAYAASSRHADTQMRVVAALAFTGMAILLLMQLLSSRPL